MSYAHTLQLLTVAALTLGACAGGGSMMVAQVDASGTANFQLGAPRLYATERGSQIVGVACRRNTSTILSPQHVRIEHIAATGDVLDTVRAYLPPISFRAAERCSHYDVAVAWKPTTGESVRSCFDRGKPCETHQR